MPHCPFYACRWPERSPKLEKSEPKECGLDVDRQGPCRMEQQGRSIDLYSCPLALAKQPVLRASEHLITFPGDPAPTTLLEWKDRFR